VALHMAAAAATTMVVSVDGSVVVCGESASADLSAGWNVVASRQRPESPTQPQPDLSLI
jgi:hypothetical protein